MRALALACLVLLGGCTPEPTGGDPSEGFSVVPGSIGVAMSRAAPGLIVAALRPGGPAERAGVRVGDVVQSYNGVPVRELHLFQQLVLGSAPGSTASLVVLRDGEAHAIRVPVEQLDLAPEA